MKVEANWKKGESYFWAPKATLAVHFLIGKFQKDGMLGKAMPLFYECPPDAENYHRCRIEVVRTKKEAAKLNREWVKKRATFAALAKTNK